MSLPKYTVSHPVTIAIIFVIILGLGIYATLDLPIDLYPDINPPILLVFTDYNGAGPEEVEKNLTRTLESVLS
ncbi:MAG TPA: efflux RND transporter permease subunit, partial [Spirochaetota bacterium]|nr:efflux RND transporter permease subunit [Spirochaetota bacterium]